jgi:hypothetical protein
MKQRSPMKEKRGRRSESTRRLRRTEVETEHPQTKKNRSLTLAPRRTRALKCKKHNKQKKEGKEVMSMNDALRQKRESKGAGNCPDTGEMSKAAGTREVRGSDSLVFYYAGNRKRGVQTWLPTQTKERGAPTRWSASLGSERPRVSICRPARNARS